MLRVAGWSVLWSGVALSLVVYLFVAVVAVLRLLLRRLMWLASAVGSLNVARLGGVSLKPVVNGQVSSTEAPVEAGSLWAGTGAVIFTVRRAG